MLTLTPGRMPVSEAIADARNSITIDAHDHTDHAEHMAALTIAAEAAHRIREIAAGCSRPGPMNEMAEAVEESAWPIEREAQRWDDERDARIDGNRMDNSRAFHPRMEGGA